MILDILREAGERMATRDIVVRVIELRGSTWRTGPLAETMRQRVASFLRGLRAWRSVTSSEGRRAAVRWTLRAG